MAALSTLELSVHVYVCGMCTCGMAHSSNYIQVCMYLCVWHVAWHGVGEPRPGLSETAGRYGGSGKRGVAGWRSRRVDAVGSLSGWGLGVSRWGSVGWSFGTTEAPGGPVGATTRVWLAD